MITYYHSYLSPYARRVLIVLEEKRLPHERRKHVYAREFDGLGEIRMRHATPPETRAV